MSFKMRGGTRLWARHPAVRSGNELTRGERAADIMRNAFGSWGFVFSFLTFMGFWILANSFLLEGQESFDPYPFILLNLCLSMMAGLQGALILIAAKRADRVAAEQATAHYIETAKIDSLLTENTILTRQAKKNTDLLEEIHRHVSELAPEAGRYPPEEVEREECTLPTVGQKDASPS